MVNKLLNIIAGEEKIEKSKEELELEDDISEDKED